MGWKCHILSIDINRHPPIFCNYLNDLTPVTQTLPKGIPRLVSRWRSGAAVDPLGRFQLLALLMRSSEINKHWPEQDDNFCILSISSTGMIKLVFYF